MESTLGEDQLVTVETNEATEDNQSESAVKEKKLYRCLHCDMTDSNAYLLLLHQIKFHPGNNIQSYWFTANYKSIRISSTFYYFLLLSGKLLKCSDCDFVYSADQRNKYNDHLKLHAKDQSSSLSPQLSEKTVLMQSLEGVSSGTNGHEQDAQNSSKQKSSTKVVSKTHCRKRNSIDKTSSPNGVVRHAVKPEVLFFFLL